MNERTENLQSLQATVTDLLLYEEFKEFITKFQYTEEEVTSEDNSGFNYVDVTMRYENWWYILHYPFNDFTKEIVEFEIDDYPEGAIDIRGDDNFWIFAVFPLKFKTLTVQEIVSVVWPSHNSESAVFLEDYYEQPYNKGPIP